MLLSFTATASAQIFNSHTPAGVSVTLDVPDTTISINGLTSPYSFVTVEDNGNVAATGLTDAYGNISMLLPSLTPGFQSLSIYSIDPNNVTTDKVNFSVNITAHTNTSFNEFLPPTISYGQITSDAPSIFGYGPAGSVISAYIDTSIILNTTAGANGYWSINLYKNNIKPGRHSVFALSNLNGQSSNFTRIISFTMPHIVIKKTPSIASGSTSNTNSGPNINNLINQKLPWRPLVNAVDYGNINTNQIKYASITTLIIESVAVTAVVIVAASFVLFGI